MTNSRVSVLLLLAALAAGLLAGYVDLGAQEVQGPALLLMIAAFLCAVPRRAPGWMVAIAVTLGLPLAHAMAVFASGPGGPPTPGMAIAIVPTMIAAYVGVAARLLIDATASAAGTAGVSNAERSFAHGTIIFAGIAACCALGVPIVRNVLNVAHVDNSWWIALVWQSVTLAGWCGLALAIVKRDVARSQRVERSHERDFVIHVVRLITIPVLHTTLVFAMSTLLFIPVSSPAGGMVFYVFIAYVLLDALCYASVIAFETRSYGAARLSTRR